MSRKALMALIFALWFCPVAEADLFGADVGVLSQILSENIEQLSALSSILQQSQSSFNLLEEINQGINDSLSIANSLASQDGSGGREKYLDAFNRLREIYGRAVRSPDQKAQEATDRVIVDANQRTDQLSAYAQQVDRVGEEIKNYSHSVSPGGATKLTAQGVGVLIHVMNEQLRATSTLIKLSAQSEAMKNKREKAETAQYLAQADALSTKMKSDQMRFEFPRF